MERPIVRPKCIGDTVRITQPCRVKCKVKDVSLVDVDKIDENENDPNLPDEGDQGKFTEDLAGRVCPTQCWKIFLQLIARLTPGLVLGST
jgi:hypothetical protein